MTFERRKTRQVVVGRPPGPSVAVGGDAPVSVQSMTTTKTADVDGTLAQIYALAAAGCDIVRCTCNEEAAAEGLAQIVPRSPVPIIADIHFQYRLALAAMEAGVQGAAAQPGQHPQARAHQAGRAGGEGPWACRSASASTRGSLDPDIVEQFGGATPEALVASAQRELAYFGEVDFEDVKISVKASNVAHDDRRVPPARPRPSTTRCTSASPRPGRRPPGS